MLSYRGRRLLRGFDAELGERLGEEMSAKGVKIRFGGEPQRIVRRSDGSLEVAFSDGSREETDLVMFATGRHPNSANLGLEAAGVDARRRTARSSSTGTPAARWIPSMPSAIVTNRLNLTPVATAEAMWLAQHALRQRAHRRSTTRTCPRRSSPTRTSRRSACRKRSARESFGAVDIYKASFRALKLTLARQGRAHLHEARGRPRRASAWSART